jgi:hypothetical protein
MDITTKLSALHSLVQTTLQAQDANFKVYDRPRQLELDMKSRAQRTRIMGDPIRYCEVLHDSVQADATPTTLLASGKQIRTIQRFTIEMIVEYSDGANLAASSYKTFLDFLHSESASTPGLVYKIRTTNTLTSGGEVVSLGNPDNVVTELIPVDNQNKEFVHYALITVDVI